MSKKNSRRAARSHASDVREPRQTDDRGLPTDDSDPQELAPLSDSAQPLPAEQILIDHLPECACDRSLVVSPGRAQVAGTLRQHHDHARVTAWFIDYHAATLCKAVVNETVDVVCSADLPEGEVDLVLMPVLMRGEAELTRELMQQAHERLIIGGTMAVAVDNPRDTWMREQMEAIFDKVSCHDAEGGRFYVARKQKPLKKLRNFQAEIVFRDEEHLIKLTTRPGVFAHRQLDPGARQLLLSVDIDPGQRVLDLGCGSGALAVAACLRAEGVTALAVDSNARAVECARHNAEINGVTALETQLNSDGQLNIPDSFDVVLCNPPYFSDFQIADKMIRTAHESLRSGGAALLVNKQPRWYEQRLPQSFVDVEIFPSGKYWVACGRKP